MGVRRVADERRTLRAQPDDANDDDVGVVGVAVVAARLEARPHRLAMLATRREREEWIDTRARVQDGPAREPAFARRFGRGRYQARGQAGQVFGVGEQRPGVFVREHLRAKLGVEQGQFLVDRRQAFALGGAQLRAGAHEFIPEQGDQARLLRSQLRIRQRAVHGVDAFEQPRVERDRIAGSGQTGLPLAIERAVFRRAHIQAHHVEEAQHAQFRAARTLERGHRILEIGRRGASGDLLHRRALFSQRHVERSRKIRNRHPVPRRHPAVGARPLLGQHIRL